MRIFPFKPYFPRKELISSLTSFASSAKAMYRHHRENEFYNEPQSEMMLVYDIQSSKSNHTSLLCCTDVQDSIDGRLLRHEKTLAPKEQEMMHRILESHAMLKPIALGYDGVQEVDEILAQSKNKPCLYEIYDQENKITHKFWSIQKDDADKIKTLLEQIDHAYIADGHHRNAVTCRLYEQDKRFNRLYTAYFSFDQLEILDYNRIIVPSERISGARLIAELSRYMDIQPISSFAKADRKRQMTLWKNEECFSLTWKKDISKEKEDLLDVQLFNEYILREIFHITDVRNDPRVKYAAGSMTLDETIQKLTKSENRIGFFLYPVQTEEMKKIVDMGLTMPPKSTYFEPRLLNGLVCYDFESWDT